MPSTNNRKQAVQILIPTLGIVLLAVQVSWSGGTTVLAADEPVVISAGGDGVFVVGHGKGHTAYMGVQLEEDVEHPEGGALVTEVVRDSPAEKAGLRVGDVIVEFHGNVIRGPGSLTKQIHAAEPGETVALEIRRDGRKQTLELELGERSNIWNGTAEGYTLFAPEALDSLKDLAQLKQLKGLQWSPGEGSDPGYNLFFNPGRPTLGVQLVETTPELRRHLGGSDDAGVIVSKVLAGTPAANAGIEVGDLIVSIDGAAVKDARELRQALQDKSGETFAVEVIRGGDRRRLEVKIAAPDDEPATGPRAYRVAPRPRPEVAGAVREPRLARRSGSTVI